MQDKFRDWLLPYQAARLLDRTPDAVRGLERRGILHAERIGHVRVFSRAEVERLLKMREEVKSAVSIR